MVRLEDRHNAKVTSIKGDTYHQGDHVVDGQFGFESMEEGDYMACFFAAEHNPAVTFTVDFDWKSGIAAKDWSSVAKKGSVELMEFELKKMFDTVQSIHDEMFYLRAREEEMQDLNRSTNSKMVQGVRFFTRTTISRKRHYSVMH